MLALHCLARRSKGVGYALVGVLDINDLIWKQEYGF
jgi:hypothetical protein